MTDDLIQQMGARLRTARLQARYSAAEVARYLRIGERKVLAWEAGTIHPDAGEFGRLARMLGRMPGALAPRSVFERWAIAPQATLAAYAAAPLPPLPRATSLKGRAVEPTQRLVAFRCRVCGLWLGANPCQHRRRRASRPAEATPAI